MGNKMLNMESNKKVDNGIKLNKVRIVDVSISSKRELFTLLIVL